MVEAMIIPSHLGYQHPAWYIPSYKLEDSLEGWKSNEIALDMVPFSIIEVKVAVMKKITCDIYCIR